MRYFLTGTSPSRYSLLLPLLLLFVFIISGCTANVAVSVAGQSGGNSGSRAEAKAGGERIRVLVLSGVKEVKISGSSRGSVTVILRTQRSASVNGAIEKLPLRFYPAGGVVKVNGKSYRGFIDVIHHKGKLLVVDDLMLEEYLAGLINAEISSSWHIEAIKAQAVIARTYALYKKYDNNNPNSSGHYDLTSTNIDQVYEGASSEDSVARRAVWKTRGEVLTYKGEIALTVYHSNAGGRTEASADVWQSAYPYLRSVKSPHDRNAPSYSWDLDLSGEKLGEFLARIGIKSGKVKSIKIKKKSSSGRIMLLEIKGKNKKVLVSGEDLRRAIGYGILRSTLFKINKRGGSFHFMGKGSGHGVGLSQWGAKGMAESGAKYKKILRHYYNGTSIRKIY